MDSDLYVGRRLSYDGHLCTVRYCGPVGATEGEWLGVEWDEAERGKHGGTHEGVKIFKCGCSLETCSAKMQLGLIGRQTGKSSLPTAASFIRPTRPSDPSLSFTEAVKRKYASDLMVGSDSHEFQDPASEAIRISGKQVEEIGFEKVRKQLSNLKQLRILLTDTLCISRPQLGKSGNRHDHDVSDTCPNANELDLSRNLFEDWDEVLDICRQLPKLTSLRVDGNRFSSRKPSAFLQCLSSPPFTILKSLSLDDTLLDWESVSRKLSQETCPRTLICLHAGHRYHTVSDIAMSSFCLWQ